MATIPYVQAQEVARASEQNALITQVNTNTNSIESNTAAIGSAGGTLTDLQTRVTTLEGKPASTTGLYYGQWGDANTQVAGTSIPLQSSGVKITEFNTAKITPNGCSISGGTVTVNVAGKWDFRASVQYTGNNTSVRAAYFAISNASTFSSGTKYGLIGGPTMDAQSISAIINLSAGQQVSVYVAHWSGDKSLSIWPANTNLLTVSYIGP